MPTPAHRRKIPDNVDIPALPEAMDGWFDLVQRAIGRETRWQGRFIDLAHVIDGLSAAHALADFRYERDGKEWHDLAGDESGDWRREWIVIAFDNGAPFIADVASPGVPVLLDSLGGPWRPERVHDTLTGFIEAMEIVEPHTTTAYQPPAPLPEVSVTVLDWGPERGKLIAHLVRSHKHLYRPHMFRRKVETPVLLTRRLTDVNAEAVISIIEQHGGTAEVGAAVPKQPRRPEPPSPEAS